jgi:hypothetical protein
MGGNEAQLCKITKSSIYKEQYLKTNQKYKESYNNVL